MKVNFGKPMNTTQKMPPRYNSIWRERAADQNVKSIEQNKIVRIVYDERNLLFTPAFNSEEKKNRRFYVDMIIDHD